MHHRDPLADLLDDNLMLTTISTKTSILMTIFPNESLSLHHVSHVDRLEENLFTRASMRTSISMIVDHHHRLEHNVPGDLDLMQLPVEVVVAVGKAVPPS